MSVKLLNGLIGQRELASIAISFKPDGLIICTYSFCCSLSGLCVF